MRTARLPMAGGQRGLSVLADDPKGRFDIRSLPGQVFWFWIVAAAMRIAGGGAVGVGLFAPPIHNVGVPIREIIARYMLWGPEAKRRDRPGDGLRVALFVSFSGTA